MSDSKSDRNFFSVQLVPFLVVLLVIVSFFAGGLWVKLKNVEEGQDVIGAQEQQDQPIQEQAQDQTQDQIQNQTQELVPDGTEGTFSYQNNLEICKEGGKPIVSLFSTTWCPHCVWIKDTFEKVVKEYVDQGKITAYHWELDINDDTLTSEVETEVPQEAMDVYEKFNPNGSIPTFVFGCKYWRIGNGYERDDDLAAEEQEFRDLIDKIISSS